MGDIICKWRVANVPNLIDLVRMLPHEELPNDIFRDRMGPGFMKTPYQLACQLGLYHIDENNNYIPRFRHNLTTQEAEDYLHHWILRYYAPNPYTPSFRKDLTETKALVPSLVEYAEKFPNANYEEACRVIYGEEVGNTGTILGAINSFSRVLEIDKEHKLNLLPNYKDILMADRNNKTDFFHTFDEPQIIFPNKTHEGFDIDNVISYLRAMRTKPFLLLAGISGTGKSRIVKQMAFDSCPDVSDLQKDSTSPGNYCLIEVKPNWHDSTELLGYESKIGGDHYVLTPFVKFLAKALLYPKVPFFVCLDEMNLAPVEQYFAEFLSVLESRTKIDGHIVSEPLIKADIFSNKDYILKLQDDLFGLELKEETTEDKRHRIISGQLSEEHQKVYDILQDKGLRIPENVIIIGTVNMDETTHQFSRKVIDRAMTIEMNLPEGTDDEGNEINPFKAFFENSSELAYREEPTSPSLYLATETKASDVINKLSNFNLDQTEILKQSVANFLTGLNTQLDGTPFKVAYRVQNELLLYFYQLWLENKEADWEQILEISIDQILMMKVLPRIEGDEELLEKPLERLISFCEPYPNASKKLLEMQARLKQSRFTSFWP